MPRHLVYAVARAFLPRFSEMVIADLAKIAVLHVLRRVAHLLDQRCDLVHEDNIVSIMILLKYTEFGCMRALLPLAMLARLKDRLLPGGRSSGAAVPPAFVNRTLCSIFRSERYLLDRFDLPAGVSLLAVVRAR